MTTFTQYPIPSLALYIYYRDQVTAKFENYDVNRFVKPLAKIVAVLAILNVVLFPTAAFATRYSCKTTQSFEWKDGKLGKFKLSGSHSLIFDDENGAFYNNGLPSGFLNVVQKLHPDYDLVASKEETNGNFTGNLVLSIRHINKKKPSDLGYLFWSNGSADVGLCSIMIQ